MGSTIHRSPFTVCRLPFAVCRSTVYRRSAVLLVSSSQSRANPPTPNIERRTLNANVLPFALIMSPSRDAPVAQLDRVCDFGSQGWRFEPVRVQVIVIELLEIPKLDQLHRLLGHFLDTFGIPSRNLKANGSPFIPSRTPVGCVVLVNRTVRTSERRFDSPHPL